jgi:GNAT superfamily N-acetyltransferase
MSVQLRPLGRADFEAVVSLDRQITGRERRGWFNQRLASALRQPRRHLQLAVDGEEGLIGFLLARLAGGEYGRPEDVLLLETIGVDPSARHHGLGHKMVAALVELAQARGLHALLTQVDWHDHGMTGFLDHAGFSLSRTVVVSRAVHRLPLPETDEEIELHPPLVRHLVPGDLPALQRIDQRITGVDRSAYLARRVDEALRDSAITVSLVVEDDGAAVGFTTVRVDHGVYGKLTPVATLDTIGVDPRFTGRGFARALLNQLIDNLAAIDVEWLETEVRYDDLALLRFLYRFGFAPSPRLVLERRFG